MFVDYNGFCFIFLTILSIIYLLLLLLLFIPLIFYIDVPGPTTTTKPASTTAAPISTVVIAPDPPPLISHFYEWNRKLFLTPDLGYDPYEDPLSREGQARVYRDNQLVAVLDMQQDLAFLFRNVDKQEFFLESSSSGSINNNNSTSAMTNRNPSGLSVGEFIADTRHLIFLFAYRNVIYVYVYVISISVGIFIAVLFRQKATPSTLCLAFLVHLHSQQHHTDQNHHHGHHL